jgi:AAA domain
MTLILSTFRGEHKSPLSMFVRFSSSATTDARPIYVAATRQHVGKTSASLAIMSGLQKRFDRVGFIKPVGQHCLPVWEEDLHQEIRADKDVVVMRQHFGLDHLPYRYMSPVLIPKGYTRDFIDGKISQDTHHEELIRKAYSIRRFPGPAMSSCARARGIVPWAVSSTRVMPLWLLGWELTWSW